MRQLWLPGALLLLLLPMTSAGQAATTTTLTSNSPTLQLPGSLTLTSKVAPPAATGGMPTGNVSFYYDNTNLVGSAPLSIIPATENFLAPPATATMGYYPFGLFTTAPSAGPSGDSMLGVLDYNPNGDSSSYDYPEITIYAGKGGNPLLSPGTPYIISPTTITTTCPGAPNAIPECTNIYNVDSYAVADFTHHGGADVLLHSQVPVAGEEEEYQAEYFVIPGTAAGVYNLAGSIISPDVPGNAVSADPMEAVAVDDFNGDGYPDVAFAGTADAYYSVGVVLNAGAAAPGSFPSQNFYTASPVTFGANEPFEPVALASGHFTSSGRPDLVVAGSNTGNGAYLVLYLNQGVGTSATPFTASTPIAVGSNATSIATAVATGDFRNNGFTDVVVASSYTPVAAEAATPVGTIQVLSGNGTGGLGAASSTVSSCAASAPGAAAQPLAPPGSLLVADFNGDGYPDILSTGQDGSLCLMLNQGNGTFGTTGLLLLPAPTITVEELVLPGYHPAVGDFNGDGLPDIAEISAEPIAAGTDSSAAFALLNSASSHATLTTAPETLPAGTQTLTATYPGDTNFAASTSAGLAVTITQTVPTVTWAAPAAMEYGIPLGPTQLDATASVSGAFSYAPAAGTILAVGQTPVTATFAPTDSFDYSAATATQTITVVAAPATVQASVSATVEAGQQPSVTLTVSPYPIAVAATLTLSFTPAPPGTVTDTTVVFANNKTTSDVVCIGAESTAAIPPIGFEAGTTAGTITLTVQLTDAEGTSTECTPGSTNIPVSNLQPISISVPASPPGISSAVLTPDGDQMTLVINGFSPTRDLTSAEFHFTAAPGKSLKTTDLPVQLGTPAAAYYSSSASDSNGTTFVYTQPFALSSDATDIASVTVTLTNSNGTSQPTTVQPATTQ